MKIRTARLFAALLMILYTAGLTGCGESNKTSEAGSSAWQEKISGGQYG